MKEQGRIFFTALMFYTRIPCPSWVDHSPEYINKATRYFPLIGWIVGAFSFAGFAVGHFLYGPEIGVVLSLMVGVLTTGGFHEDGLADVYDGFGGGWTKEKILEIMKDSRVGAYGVIALILLFLFKFLALSHVVVAMVEDTVESWTLIGLLFLSYHALARLTAINLVFTMPYAREDANSKAKPIAQAHSATEVAGAYLFGLLPLAGLVCFQPWAALVVLPLAVLYFRARRYFTKWLQGYTGDCLGAIEQLAELVVLLTFAALWKFI
ncbi:MAG: adenosylcobinamide-GDP ribazoletransferase [Salibacteraceae bacterium]